MSGKTSNESKRKYNEKAYSRFEIAFGKEEKPLIEAHAKQKGFKSLAGYIKDLINTDMNSSK